LPKEEGPHKNTIYSTDHPAQSFAPKSKLFNYPILYFSALKMHIEIYLYEHPEDIIDRARVNYFVIADS
jgi:hypothetical protein